MYPDICCYSTPYIYNRRFLLHHHQEIIYGLMFNMLYSVLIRFNPRKSSTEVSIITAPPLVISSPYHIFSFVYCNVDMSVFVQQIRTSVTCWFSTIVTLIFNSTINFHLQSFWITFQKHKIC